MSEHEHEMIEELEARVKNLESIIKGIRDSSKSAIERAEQIKSTWGGYPGSWAYLDGVLQSHIMTCDYALPKRTDS